MQAPTSAPAENGDVFVMPCSVAQKRFWMLEQISPGNTALLVPIALQLSGPLDAGLLQQALNAIVARHEDLRTTFAVFEGEPMQVVAPEGEFRLERIEIESITPDQIPEVIRREMLAEVRRPLDFSRAPLFRATLVRLGETEHLLMFTAHHIATDGWSCGILVRELAAFYTAAVRRQPAALPPLQIQYADYAIWQDGWLKTEAFRQQLAFWDKMLEGDLPVLDFPTDFSRQTDAAAVPAAILETLLLPPTLTEDLKQFCREEGVTLFMVLYSGYVALLRRYTGQEDFLVGTTAANRNRPELEALIGLFANILVPRSRAPAGISFREFLARQREVLLGSFANHEAPFEAVIDQWQRRQKGGARKSVLQTHFLFQKAFMQPDEGGGIKFQPLRSVSPGSTFELTFGIVERASEGIRLQMEYRISLYQGATIRRLLHHFQALLESIVAHPEMAVDDLPIFAAGEREELESRLAALSPGDAAPATLDPASVAAALDRQLDVHLRKQAPAPFLSPVELPPGAVLIALDSRRRILPIGIPGELHLGTRGTAIEALSPTGFLGRNTEGGAAVWGRAEDIVVQQGYRLHRRSFQSTPAAVPKEVSSEQASMQSMLHRQLLELWRELLKTPDLTIEDNFFECGGTSLLALRMMLEVGKLCGRPLPLSLLLTGATIAHLTRFILESWRDSSDATPLIPLRTEGSRPPLFFLHGDWAGGGFYCRQLAEAFGAEQPFYAAPPYRRTESKFLSMADMAAWHCAAIREKSPRGPYLLGGYCIGATVALEVARQLIAEGETVGHLFLVEPPFWQGSSIRRFWPWIDKLGTTRHWDLGKKIEVLDRYVTSSERWLRSPWQKRWASIRRRVPFLKGTSSDAAAAAALTAGPDEGEMLEGLDYSVYYLAYRLHRLAPISVPATLYFSEATAQSGLPGLASASRMDPALYQVEKLPGTHTTCVTRDIGALAEKMERTLASFRR